VTVVEPDLVGSALLVAVTVSVPAFDGAVYMPDEVIAPRTAFHVTVLLVDVPCTLAVNGKVPEVIEEAVAGLTVTDVTVGTGPGTGPVGVTVTWAEFTLSPAVVTTDTT
jgi:hypothetical protein